MSDAKEQTMSGAEQDVPTMSGQQAEQNTFTGGKKKGKDLVTKPDFEQHNIDLGNDSNIADFLINQVMSFNLFASLHDQVADKLKLVPILNGDNNFGRAWSALVDGYKYQDKFGEWHESEGIKDQFKDPWRDVFKSRNSPKKDKEEPEKETPKKEKEAPKKEKGAAKKEKGAPKKEAPKKDKETPKKETPKKDKEAPKKDKKPRKKTSLKEVAQEAKKRKNNKDNKAKEGKRKASAAKPVKNNLAQLKKFKNKMRAIIQKHTRSHNNNKSQQKPQIRPNTKGGRG